MAFFEATIDNIIITTEGWLRQRINLVLVSNKRLRIAQCYFLLFSPIFLTVGVCREVKWSRTSKRTIRSLYSRVFPFQLIIRRERYAIGTPIKVVFYWRSIESGVQYSAIVKQYRPLFSRRLLLSISLGETNELICLTLFSSSSAELE